MWFVKQCFVATHNIHNFVFICIKDNYFLIKVNSRGTSLVWFPTSIFSIYIFDYNAVLFLAFNKFKLKYIT